jgi:hypothetical protein
MNNLVQATALGRGPRLFQEVRVINLESQGHPTQSLSEYVRSACFHTQAPDRGVTDLAGW